ncbi:hypothetical protein, partial [Burkholderia aenigmatica]|uniref:hypothetical protein n=1 Tax=Burkholderia aenigmatica TaxID=2015348 RepID=UPI0028D2D97B
AISPATSEVGPLISVSLAPFLFPIVAPILWIITLGDLIYMGLDRILPRRKWPQELIDACDGVWDGRDD